MTSLADLLNSPTEIEFEGKVYQLREPTLEECGMYQRWLEAEARAGAAAATDLPEDQQDRLLRAVSRDIAAQVYCWGGEECVNSLNTPTGMGKLLSIVCRTQGLDYGTAVRMCNAKLFDVAKLLLKYSDDPEKKTELDALLKSVGLPPDFLSKTSSGSSTTPAAPPTSSP